MVLASIDPGSPAAALPQRRHVREGLAGLVLHNTPYALTLVAVDAVLLAAALLGLMAGPPAWAQALLGALSGLIIGRLFVLGHDACHQSLTPHRNLNRWIGRLVFLPSLTPYSVWEMGHNVVHHTHANLKGYDPVWVPLSPQEYRALPAWRRLLERIFRSSWAPGLYYLIEVWWTKLVHFDNDTVPTRRGAFARDKAMVLMFGLGWIGTLVAAAVLTEQSIAWLLFTGFVLPQVVWHSLIGFVVFLHHTHPAAAWYDERPAWVASHAYASTTVHLKMSTPASIFLHHIMEHTAHHVDMRLPCYRLRDAQRLLEAQLPGVIIVQPFSWRWYREATRVCKLYDYRRGCWAGFDGQPTSPPNRC